MSLFINNQNQENISQYVELLQTLGSLSNLFSESDSPFLYYRAHENLFCKVFNAKNLSRGDISFDAIKNDIGIGLKTFLNSNGNTFQKIAEFNSDSYLFRDYIAEEDLVYKVAELRNKRIETTMNMTGATHAIYHLVTREPLAMNVVETTMDFIDLDSIKIIPSKSKNTIRFKDRYNEYSFSLSKNTLLQRFNTTKGKVLLHFSVQILEDPFDLLSSLTVQKNKEKTKCKNNEEYIVLPLYSPSIKKVPEKSGLNQWNAAGRVRHPDEVYIPIPMWIHKKFPNFFVYSRNKAQGNISTKEFSPDFSVELPNGNILDCKLAQQGGKALMSNPNKMLGEWILRDVLKLPEGVLVTSELLDQIGIDSVKLTKKNDTYYYLDFLATDSFEEFNEEFNI